MRDSRSEIGARDWDQPPLYPGMRCALKPEFIDMEHLRRQTTVSEKTCYRGLPHKHNLAVPMLRKWVVHQMNMIPRQEFARMSSKAVSAKVSGLTHPASKWYQWLCLNIELEKAELVYHISNLIKHICDVLYVLFYAWMIILYVMVVSTSASLVAYKKNK